jgi:purine nucleosidase
MKAIAAILSLFLLTGPLSAQPPRIPIVIDTDIASDIDDALALALALASPELDVQGITTCAAQAEDRAWIVCRLLSHAGVQGVPVAAGKPPQPEYPVDGQIQYRRHPGVLFNRTQRPEKAGAVEFLHERLKAQPGKLTIVALGPLTNVARLLDEYPDAKKLIRHIVLMGGSIDVGYSGKPPAEPEWNVKADIAAAKTVFASGVPLVVVPLDATAKLALTAPKRERLFSACTPLTLQVQALYELWDKETPILFDPAAVAAVLHVAGVDDPNPPDPTGGLTALSSVPRHIRVDDKGMTLCVPNEQPNARVVLEIKREQFIDAFVERVRSLGKTSLPPPPKHRVLLRETSRFPAKVHVVEDYDTDIEKRWWLAGKLETKDVPPGGRRAQRGVLTQDFDDRQGQLNTSYRAVVFNPVPGPPMGPNTRLSFRYKISGTDILRVQLYSLSNGYHRYLSVDGLVQNEWRHATVDMTQMRRPDGSGGPLSANERIDDIQFYADPRAELLIDDIVLYEEAAADEQRRFPKRILFTGWFDTGKQGQEWPGEFEIVSHDKPRTWKCIRAVQPRELPAGWVLVHLRGERRLAPLTELSFDYRLETADKLTVELAHGKSKRIWRQELTGLRKGEWATATVRFTVPEAKDADVSADQIRFLLPSGAGTGLWLDNVLLYEPAGP